MINRALRCPQFHLAPNTASSGYNYTKRGKSFQYHICTLANSALRMTNVIPEELSILCEDEHIIVVDKAANIVSVPGKSSRPFTKFRCDQWQDAIRKAAAGEFDDVESDCQKNLQILADTSSIPRKESRFLSFIAKTLKVVDKVTQQSMWKRICDADILLNRQPFEDIPNHLVSTADLVEKHCGHKIFVVHRLDMETSGVIIYAKTEDSSAELCRQFREREIEKVYHAKVAHRVVVQSQTITAPMGPDPTRPMYQVIGNEDGKDAITRVDVLDYHDDVTSSSPVGAIESSYVRLMPLTGRSHQLRVHMAHIGHPILGDTMYAPNDVVSMYPRLCLHAQLLKFKHPFTNEPMSISSPQCVFFPKSLVY